MCSPGRDAAVEKGNETSPALLYLSSSLCRCQNAPSSVCYRLVPPPPPPGRTEKRVSRQGLAVGALGQKKRWTTKCKNWRGGRVLSKRTIRYDIAILHEMSYPRRYLSVNFPLITSRDNYIEKLNGYNWFARIFIRKYRTKF